MRNPYLKEHLLDVGDKAGAELGQAIRRRWQLDFAAIETQKEKSIRLLSVQEMAVIIAYGIVVAVYVISSAVAMWSTSSGALEILFTLSFLQGPFVIYQRLQLIKSTVIKEAIAALYSHSKALKEANDGIVAEKILTMQEKINRLRSSTSMEGYDVADITDLYNESERINEQKKLLAEAIGIEKLTKSILGTNDNNHNHYVGAAELNLLAQRMQSIEGAPFTSEELQYRFRQGKTQNLVHLADVVRRLYVESRRKNEQSSIQLSNWLESSAVIIAI